MSSSVSNISFRYHPEDEQLEDNYDTSSSISTSSISIKSEGNSEENNTSVSSSEVPSSVLGRLGIREETDKWKLFREVKGRITKSVEEKIEEIKTERLKNQSKQRRSVLGQMENSSLSDSEEQSESSPLSASDKSLKSAQETLSSGVKIEKTDEKAESDVSVSQGSSPERSTTPVPPSPDELVEEELDFPIKRGKGLKGVLKKKKGKTKNDKGGVFDKTTISYSALCDNDTDSETVELGQEVREGMEVSDTQLARELDRLAHPSLFKRIQTFICNWHMFLLPFAASLLNWFTQLPQYVVGAMVGVVGILVLQKLADLVRAVLGSEPPLAQLKDLLPLTGVPIFRRSIYESDVADTQFEGWMNEYTRQYRPETYHISLTESVYVRLDGSRLRLSSPRGKVPKRALWNEPRYKLQFNRERLYDITGCSVQLKPDGLIHRRSWSKKYPICLMLNAAASLGVRYREKNQETVDEDAPWVEEEEKYNFDTVSEDSDDDQTSVPSLETLPKEDSDSVKTRISQASVMSMDTVGSEGSLPSTDFPSMPHLQDTEVDDIEEDFVKVTATPQQEIMLYLFARTDREKEIWYRRLVAALKRRESPKRFRKSSPSIKEQPSSLDYLTFMLQLSQRTVAHLPNTKEQNSKSNVNTADLSISLDMMWLNAFLGRLLYDVFQDPDKIVKIQEKIQRKLSAIRLPIFLEELVVSHLDLGQTVPIVQRATRPTLNAQGVWVDLDIVYEGGFKMTVDTKLNLNRIKQLQAESPGSDSPHSSSPAKTSATAQVEHPKSAVYDSEVEDSAETSSEEPDSVRPQDPQASTVQHKYLRILDKVAQSKYFQQVVDYKFIKKFVSGNNLQLEVEVKGLLGTLVLNLPPPPTDRLWYGFRTNPKLWLSAQPKFGQHAVHVISRIIEKKLCLEFQRILVLPNMDDLLVPLMNHTIPS